MSSRGKRPRWNASDKCFTLRFKHRAAPPPSPLPPLPVHARHVWQRRAPPGQRAEEEAADHSESPRMEIPDPPLKELDVCGRGGSQEAGGWRLAEDRLPFTENMQ